VRTGTEHELGDFYRRAVAALGPLLDGAGKLTVRLTVDDTKYRQSAYLPARVEQRIGSAQELISLDIYGDGVSISIADLPRYGHIRVGATVAAQDRPAVARLGGVLSDALYALATEFEVRYGNVYNMAESLAHYIQTRTSVGTAPDGYEILTDLAWRHVIPATELTDGVDPGLDCVQRLPDGSAWVALPGDFDVPPDRPARAFRETVYRALFPSRDADAYAQGLAERAAWLAPVTVRWDEDLADVLTAWVEKNTAPEAHSNALAWSDRTADVPAWDFASDLDDTRHTVSERLPAILEPYGGEALALIHQSSMPKLYPPRSEQLPRIDLAAVYDRTLTSPTSRGYAVPAIGAYLGEVLVSELGGRWLVPDDLPVPPEGSLSVPWPIAHLRLHEQRRVGVVVGSVVVYPFERARLLVDKQYEDRGGALAASLTKFFKCAERWLTTPPDRQMSPVRLAPLRRLPDTIEPRAHATHIDGRVAVAAEWAIYIFDGTRSADGRLDMSDGSLIATCAVGFTSRLAFAGPDLLASGSMHGELHVWDARSGYRLQTFRTGGHGTVIHVVAAGSDTIAFGTASGRIGLVRPGWHEPAVLRRSGKPAGALALSPAGDELFAGMPAAIVRFDVTRAAETARIPVPRVTALCHGGTLLGYATLTGEVGTVDLTDTDPTPHPIGQLDSPAWAMFRTGDGWFVVTESAATIFGGPAPVPVDLPDPAGRARTITLAADGVLLLSGAGGVTAVALPESRSPR
jgi:hypothetical protein